MPRLYSGTSVFAATVDRLETVYRQGHRVVHSFSGGKDSLVVMECAIIAARRAGRLPVEVVMRDEELGFPDHYEFCERTANRPEVDFHWIVAGEPHWWAYSRNMPFWWSFDNRLPPSGWMRQPPADAVWIPDITITAINNVERFPPPAGHDLVTTMGLRAEESRRRMMGVMSQGGWLQTPVKQARGALPIYDWHEKDVWRAIAEFGWDYPRAYNDLHRAGVPRRANRMGAFLNPYAAPMMKTAAKIWPDWFSRLYDRFPGLRTGIAAWEQVTRPTKLRGESWQQAYYRLNVREAPAWIAARAEKLAEAVLRRHTDNPRGSHDPGPFPDDGASCFVCGAGRGNWRQMTAGMFLGDPFSETTATGLPYVQPEEFRPELAGTPAGKWGRNGRGHPG